jgi:hypothetical protein
MIIFIEVIHHYAKSWQRIANKSPWSFLLQKDVGGLFTPWRTDLLIGKPSMPIKASTQAIVGEALIATNRTTFIRHLGKGQLLQQQAAPNPQSYGQQKWPQALQCHERGRPTGLAQGAGLRQDSQADQERQQQQRAGTDIATN